VDFALATAFTIAGFAAVVWVVAHACRTDPDVIPGRQPLDTGPAEPCWTEEIRRDGALSLARGECVKSMLMELDKRAARGDFPIPLQTTQAGG
jgi:hypothetical protein